MALDWDDLRYLLAVHRGGSLKAAAAALGVDRATVIRRVDSLERALRAKLLDRRRHGATLTDAGRRVLGVVESMEAGAATIAARTRDDERAVGPVRLTLPEFVAHAVVVPALPSLARAHPGLSVELLTDLRVYDLLRLEADVAVRNVAPAQHTLVARTLGEIGYGLYASAAYLDRRGPPDERFTGHSLVVSSRPEATPGTEWLLDRASGAAVVLRATEHLPMLAAVREGLGVAVLPCVLAHREPTLRRVPPGVVGTTKALAVMHRDLRRSARVRAVLEMLVERFRAGAAALRGE